jgi:hypothetical protein
MGLFFWCGASPFLVQLFEQSDHTKVVLGFLPVPTQMQCLDVWGEIESIVHSSTPDEMKNRPFGRFG